MRFLALYGYLIPILVLGAVFVFAVFVFSPIAGIVAAFIFGLVALSAYGQYVAATGSKNREDR